jgi:hypothetical protein
MVLLELYTNCTYFKVLFEISYVTLMYVRFICITILHLQMVDTTGKYLNMMKFAINHPYLFC